MEGKSENTKLYKHLRTEHLVLKQQFEILQASFGKALDRITELEHKPVKALDRITELEHKPVKALKNNSELERELAKALEKNSELERKLAKALKKISELERKLAQHDNAPYAVVEKGHRPEGKITTWKAAAKRQRQKWHGKTARRAEGTQGSHVQACPNAL